MALQTCILHACYPTQILLRWLYVYMLMGLWLIALNKISIYLFLHRSFDNNFEDIIKSFFHLFAVQS